MNWDAIGAFGEIAGAIAVVVSLVYLASQIRHSNNLMSMEASRFVAEQSIPIADLILENPDLMKIQIKDRNELDDLERSLLHLLGRRMIIAARQVYLSQEEVRDLDGVLRVYRGMYHRPGVNYGMPDCWPEFKKINSPDFVKWFDENIAN